MCVGDRPNQSPSPLAPGGKDPGTAGGLVVAGSYPFVQVGSSSFGLLPNHEGLGSDTKRVESATFLKDDMTTCPFVKPRLSPPVEKDCPILGPALQEALNAEAPALKRTTASEPRSCGRDHVVVEARIYERDQKWIW